MMTEVERLAADAERAWEKAAAAERAAEEE